MAKKLPKPDLQSLPACAADFIRRIIKKMRYRKKVRADVAAELIAHFEDELKEYSTDEQKEQKAQLLIDAFGDIKLLAVLLRRAKKRCRPLWRTLVARGFQTAGLLILCLIVYIAWFLSGKPVITTNYVEEYNRMVRPAADESLNAAPLYHKAIELYESSSETVDKLIGKKYNDVSSEEKQLIEKWLADNKNILDLVIAGSKKPYCWLEYREGENTDEMMSMHLPNLSGFRRLAYALHWRTSISADEARYEDAFNDIKACYRLGRHLKGDKTLIEQMLGIAIEALAIQELYSIISRHEINSAILASLQNDFEQIIADEDFIISFDAEKLFMYDEIQRCFTEDRIGRGHISLAGLRRMQLLSSLGSDYVVFEKLLKAPLHISFGVPLHILFTHPDKQQSMEMADRYYAFCDQIAQKSPGQIHSETIDVEKKAAEIIRGNILLESLVPAFSKVSRQEYANKGGVEAALTIIAILRYKQDTADFPEDLEQLVTAGYLKEIPLDSFSDNKPLVYKKTEDSFVLYSVSLNYTDDGGRVVRDKKGRVKMWAANEGDWVFWPVQD
ncbi:MAG: hypothetical protein ACYS9Y_11025 [Planctomycetota bacterium]|jgi:hypothetical protein